MDLGYMQRPRVVFRNNILNTRAQLLEVFFRRVAFGYTSVFSVTARRLIEFVFLVQAVFVLVIFIHLHITFVKSPITCLDSLRSEFSSGLHKSASDSSIKSEKTTNTTAFSENSTSKPSWSWLRYGILRIEVIPSPDPSYSLADSYAKEFYGTDTEYTLEVDSEHFPTHNNNNENGADADNHSDNSMLMLPVLKNSQHSVLSLSFGGKNLLNEIQNFWHSLLTFPSLAFTHIKKDVSYIFNQIYIDEEDDSDWSSTSMEHHAPSSSSSSYNDRIHSFQIKIGRFLSIFKRIVVDVFVSVHQFFRDILTRIYTSPSSASTRTDDDSYIIEYALEYGFLRLSPQARKQFNITVKLVVLDPQSNPCFGGVVSRFLMDEFLGYEDLLIGSIKYLSATEGLKGYVVNVMNGQHYRLVSAQMSWSSYFAAGFIMLLFTYCVSTLLRYSSQQLVVGIADVLQMFETNVPFRIPVASFLTVILALVAIETIMSEFFGDSITAFYVIVIVSVADQYEAVFCRTGLSRKYWPRFFYMYHFGFYAYHYRFNGQFSGVALMVSWLFILHSIIYFFHHYELPSLLLGEWELHRLVSHHNNNDHVMNRFHLQIATPASTTTTTRTSTTSSWLSSPSSSSVQNDRNISFVNEVNNSIEENSTGLDTVDRSSE